MDYCRPKACNNPIPGEMTCDLHIFYAYYTLQMLIFLTKVLFLLLNIVVMHKSMYILEKR